MVDELITSFPRCKECGYIHPPEPVCRIKHAKSMESTERGKYVNRFLKKLTEYLYESPAYKEEIKHIERILGGKLK